MLVVVEPAVVLTVELVGAVATIIMAITHKASVCAFSVGTVDGALGKEEFLLAGPRGG